VNRPLRVAVAAAVLSAGGAIGGAFTVPAGAHADALGTAQAKAAVLRARVDHLQTAAEVATERYDALEARLGTAVTGSIDSDRDALAARRAAVRARARIDARVQAIYAAAGPYQELAAFLAGTPATVVARTQLSQNVIGAAARADGRDATIAGQAQTRAGGRALTARHVVRLQRAAARERARITGLLAASRSALASASAQVRRIEAQQARAAARASAAAFAASVSAAAPTFRTASRAPNSVAAAAIAAARTRLGDPYVWGATGPDSFDCSGLTQWAYARAGIELPRVANEQWYAGPHPSLNALEPGDLLFYATDLSDPVTIHHVTLYIGHGMMIAAPHTGTDVQIQPVYDDGLFGATRPSAARS
jgi:cell wall-associated NlpC family hydrolase